MPFAYFQRLTRRQQAIYLESDGLVTMPLPQAGRLQPVVTALARALEGGDRATTEAAAQRLVAGLARALGAPPVRVTVLAARPHAKWGELHGLYEIARARPGAAADHALDAHRAAEARGGLPHLSPHAPPRDRAPRGLYSAAAGRLLPHPGLLRAGIAPVPSTGHRRGHSHGKPRGADGAHGAHGGRLRGRHQGRVGRRAQQAPGRQELVGQGVAVPRARHRGVLHDPLPDDHGDGRAAVPARRSRPLGDGAPVSEKRRGGGAAGLPCATRRDLEVPPRATAGASGPRRRAPHPRAA